MAPKSRMKKKATAAGLTSGEVRKKQRTSLESTEPPDTASETSHPLESLSAAAIVSAASTASVSSQIQSEPTTPLPVSSHESPSLPDPSSSITEELAVTPDATETQESDEMQPSDPHELLGRFAKEWVESLDRDDTKSLALFLSYQLVDVFSFSKTNAAEYAAAMVHKTDRTVRQWRSGVIENNGVLPESQQGRYQRNGVLWNNEELNKRATEYVRQNTAVKGRPNLTSTDFCQWINNSLLPNSTLEPGFPRKVSVETARLWLHHLGFEVLTAQKGIFIDGHERPDVIEARKLFLRKLTKIGFLHFTNAPTEEAARSLPEVDCPTSDVRSKAVVFFHDETTFMSNEDQPTQWGMKGEKMMKPKSRGAGIMVSDFVDEHNGFLALSDAEYDEVKATKPHLHKYARKFLEYGENREGYWTRDRFIKQMKMAIEISETKYPKEEGWRHVWVFDHSSCHAAMADDALDVNKMNVRPGGKQRIMRDTTWDGRVWKMYYTERDGKKVAKGPRMVLEERGVSTVGMNADEMRNTLSKHSDFRDEKSMVERMLIEKGHIPCFLPKFHPELNPIERVWAQLKRYTKAHCKYSLPSLRKNIPLAYDSVSLENIKNHFRKVRHYMFSYVEGLTPGKELDQTLLKYKSAVKSHRRIGEL